MAWSLSIMIVVLSVFRLNAESQPFPGALSDSIPARHIIDDSISIAMQEQTKQVAMQMAKADLTYFIIRVPDQKFGYTIFIDGQMYIEQKTIPAVAGNAGFSSERDAEKIAKLVIGKIKAGEMPPSISIEDLKALNVVTGL